MKRDLPGICNSLSHQWHCAPPGKRTSQQDASRRLRIRIGWFPAENFAKHRTLSDFISIFYSPVGSGVKGRQVSAPSRASAYGIIKYVGHKFAGD